MIDPNWTLGLTLFETRGVDVWIEAIEFAPDYTCIVDGKRVGL